MFAMIARKILCLQSVTLARYCSSRNTKTICDGGSRQRAQLGSSVGWPRCPRMAHRLAAL